MSQASIQLSPTIQPHRLQDLARSPHDAEGPLPEFQYIQRKEGTWVTGQISLQDLCAEQESSAEMLIVFLPSETALIRAGAHKVLSKRFSIPASFWTDLALDASGFFRSHVDEGFNGITKGYSSQFRFLVKQPDKKHGNFISNVPKTGVPYVWHRLGFSTSWKPSSNISLCFDLPMSFRDSLVASIPTSTNRLHPDVPFSLHSVLTEGVIELYNTALWSWRDVIRDIEKNRTSVAAPEPDYVMMHELARHVIHSSEILAMAVETTTSMIQDHEIFTAEHPTLTSGLFSNQTGKDLRYLYTLFKSFHFRSKALEERLRNEINLAFNIVTQHDSRVAMRIADATQVDSAAMKTIATLGLLFLPGTYICAIFSTTFFNFSPGSDTEPQNWTISEKFWLYWVVAIPVTGVTVLSWFIWQRWYANKSILKRPRKVDFFEEGPSSPDLNYKP